MRVHSGVKPYKCLQCEYAAPSKTHLRAHSGVHTGETPFKCKECNFASNQVSNLSTHMKMHSGEKSHKCNQCEYSSYLASSFKIHIITHTGEKSHKCNMCEYAAYQASSLKTHMKKHVEEKPRIKTCKKPINDSLILNVDNNLKQKVAVPKYISGDLQKLGEQINSMVESSQNIIQHGKMQTTRAKICKVCRKEGDPSEIRRHIEAQHLDGVSLPCKDCEKTFRRRASFWQHTRTWHTLRASKHPSGNSIIYH